MTAQLYFSSSASFAAFAFFLSSLLIAFFFSLSFRCHMYIFVKSHFLNSLIVIACGPPRKTFLNPSQKFFTKTSFCA